MEDALHQGEDGPESPGETTDLVLCVKAAPDLDLGGTPGRQPSPAVPGVHGPPHEVRPRGLRFNPQAVVGRCGGLTICKIKCL